MPSEPPNSPPDLSPAPPCGILVLDKPAGISSAGLLNRLKRLLPRKTKIGHAGTLDPFATGVLLALIGKATKRCEELMGSPKSYRATVKLGATTATLDPDSPESPVSARVPALEEIQKALEPFSGQILQMPPAFSALKVGGKRAYDLARAGKVVELQPRPVVVYRLKLVSYQYPEVVLDMDVGRGFYVRSLAHDLGRALGTGGYLTALRRTRVGPFDADSACQPGDLTPEKLLSCLK